VPNPERTLKPEMFVMMPIPLAQRVGDLQVVPPQFSERGARPLHFYERVRSSLCADPSGSEANAGIGLLFSVDCANTTKSSSKGQLHSTHFGI